MANTSSNATTEDWMSSEIIAAKIAIDVVILVVSVLGNFLVIFTILREKKLRTTCNFLLVHLAVSDISLVTTSIPFEIYCLVHGSRWDFGFVFCKLLWPTNTLFYITGALILTVISIDRYRVFVQTFKPKLRRAQVRQAIVFVYIFAVLSVVPYSLVLEMQDNRSCAEAWPMFLYRQLYTIFLFCFQYALPLFIMFFVYMKIGLHLTQKTQRVRLSKRGPRTRISLYSSSTVTENRQNKARQQRSKKALKMILTVVIVFAVFMLPFQLLWIVADIGEGIAPEQLSKLGELFVIFSYIGSCTLNPFIYGVADKRFRQGYRSFLNKIVRVSTTRRSRKNYQTAVRNEEGMTFNGKTFSGETCRTEITTQM